MNLKNYITKKMSENTSTQQQTTAPQQPTTAQQESLHPEDALQRYSGMSEENLLQEMRRVAEAERKNGSLNNTDLEKFYQNAQSMLTPEQAAKMRNLIEELKR